MRLSDYQVRTLPFPFNPNAFDSFLSTRWVKLYQIHRERSAIVHLHQIEHIKSPLALSKA